MKIVAIVQARIGSSRLNAKVLKPLGGTTVIEFLVSRLKKSSLIDEIIIATSNEDRDDQIESLFNKKMYRFFGDQNMMFLIVTLVLQSKQVQILL